MYFHVREFINEIAQGEPDPAAANALQEGLGEPFGERRTMISPDRQEELSREHV
jgi:Mn-containing catalase